MKIAIYPGSFDPITLGHLDIIRRAARCFDKVCVCVMVNCQKKQPMFTPERRLELIRQSVADVPNVEVENWSCLLADFAREKGAHNSGEGRAQLRRLGAGKPDGAHQRRHLPRTGDGAAARQCGVRALQLHHGAGDDPLPPAIGKVCTGAGRRGIDAAAGVSLPPPTKRKERTAPWKRKMYSAFWICSMA